MKTLIEVSWIDGRVLDYENVSPAIEELAKDTKAELVQASFIVVDSQIKLMFEHENNVEVYPKVVEAFEKAGLMEGIFFMLNEHSEETSTNS